MIPHQYQWQNHNGASHRKNVDTPSLVGLRLEPNWFPLGITQKTQPVPIPGRISAVSISNRAQNTGPEVTMPTDSLESGARFQRIKGRETRSQSIATRFTKTEEKTLLRVASDRGMNLREWSRDVLLASSPRLTAPR